jgi:hypothetical protein
MVEFLVTVPGGTGGGYYIDGVQKPIIPVVTGGTFRFNQNAANNNGHPLILSTTTSTAGIISSGVSYYLDGASNQANYTNTSLFNAASVRYIEITVAETSDFYYLCNVHGFSMGNNMDVTSNTWSAFTWSEGSWNNQGDQIANITGNLLTASVGGPAFGWSESSWNSSELSWSGFSNVTVAIGQQVDVTGIELTVNLNSVTEVITVDVFPLGIELNTTLGSVDPGPDVAITGIELTLAVGTVEAYNVTGWSRETWGEDVWGDNGVWETVSVTGQELTLTLDSVTVLANADVDITGEILTITEGEVDPSPDAIVTGIGMNVSLSTGSVIIGTATVDLTGIGLDIGLGTATGEPITLVDITGIGLDIAQGSASGQTLVNVSVTGNGLTIATNSINTQIWTKINTGTVATWTEIDTAA